MGFKNSKDIAKVPAKAHASHASVLIDYGNYYHALHSSILKARKSIFILGWDIDSRIELVRGVDAEGLKAPTNLYDLLVWKCRKDPHVQVYMNRWDFSMFFADRRELFLGQKWRKTGLNNIHFIMDGKTTLWGCHHQKVVVIDDEVAYCGGMDVTKGRWDRRQHHVVNYFRDEPKPNEDIKETCPYHDIHTVVAGNVVKIFSQLVRQRWKIATSKEAIRYDPADYDALPNTWPNNTVPDFKSIEINVAKTLPLTLSLRQTEEILPLFLKEIEHAKEFIYIENQYFTNSEIADALHKQMLLNPKLRIVMVSSYDPNGYFEKVAMWGGRLRFRRMVEASNLKDRVIMAYPICKEKDSVVTIRVHSKILIIDDRIIHIGSANMNDRSMGFDTECDVSMTASTDDHSQKILEIRNDLIREHTGYEIEEIENIVKGELPLKMLMEDNPHSRQHLINIDDTQFQTSTFVKLITAVTDPRRPFFYALKKKFLS